MTDFRPDLPAFRVPTLVVHGTGDKTVPIDAAGRAAAKGIAQSQLVEYDGAPHGLTATQSDRFNERSADIPGGGSRNWLPRRINHRPRPPRSGEVFSTASFFKRHDYLVRMNDVQFLARHLVDHVGVGMIRVEQANAVLQHLAAGIQCHIRVLAFRELLLVVAIR